MPSASTNGKYGSPSSARSRQRPPTTSASESLAVFESSRNRRVLPTPASPESSTTVASPPATRSSTARSRRFSATRLTSGIPEPKRVTEPIIIEGYDNARRRAAVTIDSRPPASPGTLPEHSAVRSSRPLDLTGTRDRYLPPDLLLTVVRLQFAQIGKQPLQRHHEHPVRLDTVVDESQSRPEMSCPTSDDHPRIHRCPALTRPPSIVARKVVTAPVPTEAGGRCAAVPARTARSTTGPHRQRPWNHAAPHGR